MAGIDIRIELTEGASVAGVTEVAVSLLAHGKPIAVQRLVVSIAPGRDPIVVDGATGRVVGAPPAPPPAEDGTT